MFQHVQSVPFSWITVFILIWFSWLVQLSQFTCLLRRVNLPCRHGPIFIGYAVCCWLHKVLQSGGTESFFLQSFHHPKGITYVSMCNFSNSSSPKNVFKLNLVFLLHKHHFIKKVKMEILGSTYVHLCTSRQWFISSTFQCCVLIEWRLGGPQNWCENCGEEKYPCYCYQILYVDFAMKIIYVKWFYFEVKWSEVSYGEVLGHKSAMYVRVTL